MKLSLVFLALVALAASCGRGQIIAPDTQDVLSFSTLISTVNPADSSTPMPTDPATGCYYATTTAGALEAWYTRCGYQGDSAQLGGDVAPDPNPTPGDGNGGIRDVEGTPYAIINTRSADLISEIPTAGGVHDLENFSIHSFQFNCPIQQSDDHIVITDLDFDHQGGDGFHDVVGLLVEDVNGNLVELPSNFNPHAFEGTDGPTSAGVFQYTANFPGAAFQAAIQSAPAMLQNGVSAPDFSGITTIQGYTNEVDPSVQVPETDSQGETGHDNSRHGVDFDLSGLPQRSVVGIHLFYWNSYQSTTDTNGMGVCIRDAFLSKAVGDPHFTGFLQQHFLVLGEDAVYNLVSTPHLQLNAHFAPTPFHHHGKAATLMDEFGLLVGDNEVRVHYNNSASTYIDLEVNGARVAPNDFTMLLLDESGDEFVMRMPNNPKRVLVHTRESVMTFTAQAHRLPHIDQDVDLHQSLDMSTIHGLLGQTAQPGREVKDTAKEYIVDENWPWYLDGQLSDYIVQDGIFGSDVVFNRFEAMA